jgi:molybdopterin-containing oxidoreductase family iron-sulfur binding subunit
MPQARPGIAEHYATSMLIDGFATGLIARTREGRPVKIEGNPDHPMSLGATSVFHQAAVLQLYDPDRARSPSRAGVPSSWQALGEMLSQPTQDKGASLRLLLEPTSSPLVHSLIAGVATRFPEAKVTFYSPLAAQGPSAATQRLFGAELAPQYDFKTADVVVAFDSDFLSNAYNLRDARDFAQRRRASRSEGMNRLYAVEPCVSSTGTMADHRLSRPAHRIEALAAALLEAITRGAPSRGLDDVEQRWVATVGADLKSRGPGRTLLVAGERHGADTHVLVHAINDALGNVGHTLQFSSQAVSQSAGDQDISALAKELHAGRVDTLIAIGGNPAYDAPADLAWSRALTRARRSVYCGPYYNETAQASHWFGPLAHVFESWGDGRGYDGTLSLVQPLIRTLHGAQTATELLAMVAGLEPIRDYERLRASFGAEHGEPSKPTQSAGERLERDPQMEARWQAALALGFVRGSAFALTSPRVQKDAVSETLQAVNARSVAADIELNLLESPTLRDGRFANVSWLLELPTPVVKLTWDNAALMSSATAARLGIERTAPGEPHPMVELSRGGGAVQAPVIVLPGHADESVSVWLGYGRSGSERLARGVGFDAYRLRTTDAMQFATDLQIKKIDQHYPLAFRQLDEDMHNRPLALSATLAEYQAHPDFTAEHKRELPTLMPEYRLGGPQWAMSIDLSTCTGCSACVVACQAENNVLVVGKEQVQRGRDMHWLRIDSYYPDDPNTGHMVHQPMMCQHCSDAPCEYVCPVNATVHSPDGLNEMVYNRCIGTRFCSNNCPYKVRRFNWFDWTERIDINRGEVELQRNPEVTVRERGVMEKCTYCVQRIRAAEIQSRIEKREIKPGEVVTACQQACPTQAIRFGSLNDQGTPMTEWRKEPRSYFALHETGARPRTMYLARIDNPNPELA